MKLLNNLFYIALSIMAMNFLALVCFVAVMILFGNCTTGDLYDAAQVLIGNRQYSLTRDQIREYDHLKKERDDNLRRLNEAEGSDKTRADSAVAMMDVRKELEEKIRALKDLRTENESALATLREQIETSKKDLQKEREKLADWRKQVTANEMSERFQQMKKTLLAMEPAQVATYLAQILSSNGSEEAARLVRSYLPPEFRAEVFSALPAPSVRKILPLIEDQYADMQPPAIVKAWTTPGTDEYKTIEQMAQYMRQMNVPRAFTLFTLLDPKIRANLVQYLVTPDTDAKR